MTLKTRNKIYNIHKYADCEMFNQVVDHLHIPPLPLCYGETSPGDIDDDGDDNDFHTSI